MDEEVTAAQAAALTGLSERTIRRRIAAKLLPARQVARNRYAIRVQDLPIRHQSPDALQVRLQALELRVGVLELELELGGLSANRPSGGAPPRAVEATMEELDPIVRKMNEIGRLIAQLSSTVRSLATELTDSTSPSGAAEDSPRAPVRAQQLTTTTANE